MTHLAPALRICSNAIFSVRLFLITLFKTVVLLTQSLFFSHLYSSDNTGSQCLDLLTFACLNPLESNPKRVGMLSLCVCLFSPLSPVHRKVLGTQQVFVE